jgi:hypothetical protein
MVSPGASDTEDAALAGVRVHSGLWQAQVRLTTHQQRSATSQVVETMDQLSEASRQVSATANEIAAASATLAVLAADLERTRAMTTGAPRA